MAEPESEETRIPETNPTSFFSEFDSIAIIPSPLSDNFYSSSSDQAILGNSISDLRFLIDGDGDGDGEFDLNFDCVDVFYCPSENESFLIPVDATNREMCGDFTPGSGISGDTNGVLSTSGCCNQESPMHSDCSGTAQNLSLSTQESVATTASPSPSHGSGKLVVDQKLKVEEEATTKTITKRKKEIEEDTIDEFRNNTYRRSEEDSAAIIITFEEEDDEKRNARLIRNRESAQLSRRRKKHYVEELEEKVKNMDSIIKDLNSKISYFMAENATLRQQMGPGSGLCRPRHPPFAPMAYPWMQFPAYMVKPQVHLLPIPRLKPQQSMAKVKKTKKVASVSVLGLLFCLFLFGALAPIVSFSYGGISSVFYSEYEGKVLDVNNSNLQSSGSDDTTANGKMQQWFREGVAGPLFSSGICTEVFQFDASSTSGAIKSPRNTTDSQKRTKNRRILRGGLTKPTMSMVVSVLVDTREGGDGEIDGMMRGTKSLSKIFIVVLVDGVKYVTYSCLLPRPQIPHLVTT